jgi:hypothetical protein
MKLKAMTRAAVVATGVAFVGLSLAIPASANTSCGAVCTATYRFTASDDYFQAQVNNNQTGNGVTSWIWVYSNTEGDHADYYLEGDQSMHKVYTGGYGSSTSMNLSKNVTAFRVCGPSGSGTGDKCSGWYNPSY